MTNVPTYEGRTMFRRTTPGNKIKMLKFLKHLSFIVSVDVDSNMQYACGCVSE